MPRNPGGPRPSVETGPRHRGVPAVPRLRGPWVLLAVALAGFALLGWQGISTVGRTGPLDAGAYLLDAQYLDAHGSLVPAYVGYEYSAPPGRPRCTPLTPHRRRRTGTGHAGRRPSAS